jgi:hypothetical protein
MDMNDIFGLVSNQRILSDVVFLNTDWIEDCLKALLGKNKKPSTIDTRFKLIFNDVDNNK